MHGGCARITGLTSALLMGDGRLGDAAPEQSVDEQDIEVLTA